MSGSVLRPETNEISSAQTGPPVEKKEMSTVEEVALKATKSLFEELPFSDLSDHEIVELAAEEAGEIVEEEAEIKETEDEEKEEVEQGGEGTRSERKSERTSHGKRDVEHRFAKGSVPGLIGKIMKRIIGRMIKQREEAARERKKRRQIEDQKAEKKARRIEKEDIKYRREKGYAKATKEQQQETQGRKKYEAGISKTRPSKARHKSQG